MADARGAASDEPQAWDLAGEVGVVATMHRKEQVIAPLLASALGLRLHAAEDFDTDRFGTFTREIERQGTQLEAARAKVAAALERFPDARVAVASEGSFGPDPVAGVLPFGREIVVLADRRTGLELVGHHAGWETNFAHGIAGSLADAHVFARAAGFPSHGLIVMAATARAPDPRRFLRKGLTSPQAFEAAVRQRLAADGCVFLETDMRAHLNPTRMQAIARAAADLVRKWRSICPRCARPGFDVVERRDGLPCEACGTPTQLARMLIARCSGCGHEQRRPAERAFAEQRDCPVCNP